MFGGFAHIIPGPLEASRPPKDVPPPTPINFPRCHPRVRDEIRSDSESSSTEARPHLSTVLQSIIRPTEVSLRHLEALGVHVTPDAPRVDIIPDETVIPDFTTWDSLSPDEAHSVNEATRQPLSNGNLSPGCVVYQDRKRELSIPNDLAFRAVRRIPPPKGQSQVRLGNSFEFFRYLEMFSCFWDDTSKSTSGETGKETLIQDAPSSSEDGEKAPEKAPEATLFHRTGSGNQMPPEYRHSLLSAFLKLVAYDFGCNVSAPRTEPRLYVSSPTNHGGDGSATSLSRVPPRSSYFSSGCTFVFRTPTTREAARAGIVEGPVAAVSARHTFNFPPARQPSESPSAETDDSPVDSGTASSSDRDSVLDLARELVAALITAQHRAREGKTEKRIGQDAWWATKPRWGGGPGGPIGREVEMQSGADQTIGDKDVPPPSASASAETASDGVAAEGVSLNRISLPTNLRRPGPKRLKKSGNLPMYDNYRKLLPPGPTWDKKTKYTAIGRVPGADYDDIFVVSCLFHHVSVLRVRVPDRLLEVLQGASDEGIGQGTRSWGRLGVWRSKWYDLFQTEERIEAMQLIWSMMAYMMRRIEPSRAEGNVGDVRMQGT